MLVDAMGKFDQKTIIKLNFMNNVIFNFYELVTFAKNLLDYECE